MTSTSPHTPLVATLAARARAGQLELPVLPTVAAEVLASVDQDDSDARQMAELVQRDPSLAAHVLRVSNSARYAPNEPIVSLTQAIGRLGLATLREIVVSVAVKGAVFKIRGQEEFVEDLWRHALTTAEIAREVARTRRSNVEAAFLSGLLHDIGAPVVLHGLAELCEERGERLRSEEREEAIELLHTEVGAGLVDQWSLPPWVEQSILHHHAPDGAGEGAEVVRTVALADELAHWLLESEGEGLPPGLEHAEALDLYAEDVEELCATCSARLAEQDA